MFCYVEMISANNVTATALGLTKVLRPQSRKRLLRFFEEGI